MTEVEKYYRPKEVCDLLGMSIRTFWRRVKTEDGFPQPIKDGNRSLIASSDIVNYQNQKYGKFLKEQNKM